MAIHTRSRWPSAVARENGEAFFAKTGFLGGKIGRGKCFAQGKCCGSIRINVSVPARGRFNACVLQAGDDARQSMQRIRSLSQSVFLSPYLLCFSCLPAGHAAPWSVCAPARVSGNTECLLQGVLAAAMTDRIYMSVL